jgi:hypothetical protein
MLVTCGFEITAIRQAETQWNYSAGTLNPSAFSRIPIPRMIARMPDVPERARFEGAVTAIFRN